MQLQQHHQEVSGDVPPHARRLWTILRDMEWLEENYPTGYGKLIQNTNLHLWLIVLLQKNNTRTPRAYTKWGGDVCPSWQRKQQQDSHRKRWEIICGCHVIPLPVNGTLSGKISVIDVSRSYGVTITAGGTHHDANDKRYTRNWHHQSKLDPVGQMINHKLLHKYRPYSIHMLLWQSQITLGV